MKHSVMDHSGHSEFEIDPNDDAQVKEGMKRFEELVGERKFTAATRRTGETDYQVIRKPSQQLDETLFTPPKQGG